MTDPEAGAGHGIVLAPIPIDNLGSILETACNIATALQHVIVLVLVSLIALVIFRDRIMNIMLMTERTMKRTAHGAGTARRDALEQLSG